MPSNSKTDRANAQFAKLQRADDAKKALSEYETDRVAMHAKTERLKAQRMARDAADLAAAPPVSVKKPARRKKGKAASLSEWQDGQDISGRRN